MSTAFRGGTTVDFGQECGVWRRTTARDSGSGPQACDEHNLHFQKIMISARELLYFCPLVLLLFESTSQAKQIVSPEHSLWRIVMPSLC